MMNLFQSADNTSDRSMGSSASSLSSSASTSSTSASSSSSSSSSRRVGFENETWIYEVRHLETYTEREKKSMWYSERELCKLRKKIRKFVELEKDLDESVDSWRGLEFFANKKNKKRFSREEAALLSDMRAAQDCAEAYMIYLETMDAEFVNSCFHN
ncbi:expressed unknown protein [Seminavis robusta]|uniref:Uncharacterized protein n=1 Tax=Seminavis robusta TaxID=568900 RepID=A0A9N8EYI4_9STRA|nr:expressed unknown protein [Seminavis robusta]|eukprot:Sro2192_g318420.1 n/a (157) ;mRNA; r:8163-8633